MINDFGFWIDLFSDQPNNFVLNMIYKSVIFGNKSFENWMSIMFKQIAIRGGNIRGMSVDGNAFAVFKI